MPNQFNPHKILWTRENAAQFWDGESKSDSDNYFSKLMGDAILDLIHKKGVPLHGKIIDYGCGLGSLMEKLITKQIACGGVDYSPKSLEVVEGKFKGNPLYQGVELLKQLPSSLADNSCDVVFFIETIEHLLDNELNPMITELYRIVKPGGYVIVTTPHAEDLSAGELQCPECGCQYHYMQHVQSWTVDRMTQLMTGHGFNTHFCKGVLFRMKQSNLNWLRDIYSDAIKEPKPHLVYIGKK